MFLVFSTSTYMTMTTQARLRLVFAAVVVARIASVSSFTTSDGDALNAARARRMASRLRLKLQLSVTRIRFFVFRRLREEEGSRGDRQRSGVEMASSSRTPQATNMPNSQNRNAVSTVRSFHRRHYNIYRKWQSRDGNTQAPCTCYAPGADVFRLPMPHHRTP